MNFRLARLGAGDWLIGPASLILAVILFAFPWFGYHSNYARVASQLGVTVSANGWQTYEVVGPLTLVVTVLGMLTWLLMATRPTPALGIMTTIVLGPLSVLLLLWLIVKVLIFPPTLHLSFAGTGNDLEGKPAAYVAVMLSLLIVLGVIASLRREGVYGPDTPRRIETFPLT